MNNNKTLLKGAILTALAALSASVSALEKPQTMEDMWKIIQAQQKQIDEMKSGMQAQAPVKTAGSDVKQLERKTDVLSQEVEKLRTNLSIPDEVQYKSAYGLGPAASKVYQVGKGLSIGGYGEGNYQANVGEKGSNKDNADLERIVLYAGYKFTDKILFNSELEFEHATTGEGAEEKGEVSVEFASLDFFINPLANVRAGLVLMPMGFINQIHEPVFYFGNNRPEVERSIIPSTWREMGVGLFGQITPDLTYTTYVVSGLDAAEFSSKGIRDGRGGGSQAKAENFGYVARMDYTPSALPGVTVGSSAYVGNSGQNQSFAGQKADVFTQLYEAHVQWKYRGLEFRTLGSWGHINDAELLSAAKGQTIGSENYGFYTELGYDVLPLLFKDTTQYLAPFFRYETLDTIAKAPNGFADDLTKDMQIYQVGLNYKPIPNVVIKADYRNRVAKQGPLSDDFNLGFGFIF
ncbi:MAG: hypothetical protein PSU93_04400 [Methylobacter sp.]|uniref:Porin n=1 Tax=Candidatus Methylobacter titanis TaxID=3053457 RepID=A0AA43Q2D3_9GAMM|nr:hypothetical protein [Candidatus Methylobacter titanis]